MVKKYFFRFICSLVDKIHLWSQLLVYALAQQSAGQVVVNNRNNLIIADINNDGLCGSNYCQNSLFELNSFCCQSKCCDMLEFISRNK